MKHLLIVALLSCSSVQASIRLQFIQPELNNIPAGNIPANKIQVFDLRGYQDKIAFIPDMAQPTCLFIAGSLPGWLQSNLQKISLSPASNSSITVAIQQFWCETFVGRPVANNSRQPQVRLIYQFDIFSQTPSGTHAVKRLQGELSRKFSDTRAYAQLCTEIGELLTNTIQSINYQNREKERTLIQTAAFTNYMHTNQVNSLWLTLQDGLFHTIQDLQQGNCTHQKTEYLIVHRNLLGKPMITKLLMNRISGKEYPFAYTDDSSLFLHTSNGYYIRLDPISNGFLFTDMYDLAMLRRKHYNQLSIEIRNSKMDAIRNFAKVYRLYYLLDLKTGKLV